MAVLAAGCGRGEPRSAARVSVDPAALAARFGDAVWKIETEGCGWVSTGSAFAIDKRHLVTNRHVVMHDSSPKVRSRRGRLLSGRVIGSSEVPDLAVIEVGSDLPQTLAWAPTGFLSEGDPLTVMGYPIPARTFRAELGEILSFQAHESPRDALLSNAHIDRGNSGGPALRGDGTVAGVVTQMAVEDQGGQRVAIVFTADTVEQSVGRFVDRPAAPLSSCGLGPDYVPPVPKQFKIPEIAKLPPPPTVPPATAAPNKPRAAPTTAVTTPAPAPAPSEETTTPPVRCPRGSPLIEVGTVEATAVEGQEGWWEVKVHGTVSNRTGEAVTVDGITFTVPGDPPREGKGFADTTGLDPGAVTNWQGGDFVHTSEKPTTARATLDWSWTRAEVSACPSP